MNKIQYEVSLEPEELSSMVLSYLVEHDLIDYEGIWDFGETSFSNGKYNVILRKEMQ